MKKALAKIILSLTGWKVTVRPDSQIKHSVMVAAPHTSNWDFLYAILAFWHMDINLKYFIKDYYTRGPLGGIFRWTGAIGVNRKRKGNKLTDYAIELLNEKDEMVILVPAEGTRKAVDKWRTGFYRIAMEAKVPISLGFLDYEKREAGVAGVFYPTGNFEEDMHYIQEVYRPIKGKHPENYNPQIY